MAKAFQVGEWLIQPDLNLLSNGEEDVTIEPRAMQLLEYLAAHAGTVLSKERILLSVWEGTSVGDDALTGAIAQLRRALGDNARNPTYIQTVPRKGYLLIAPVSTVEDAAGPRQQILNRLGVAATRKLFPIEDNRRLRFLLPGLLLAAIWLLANSPSMWKSGEELDPKLRRMELRVPVQLNNYGSSAILSPDGNTIVFASEKDGLYLKRIDQLEVVRLQGTEGAKTPFFSPDGQWIAYFALDGLMKVSINGGAPIRICETGFSARGGSWSEDDTIVFNPSRGSPLSRVSAFGGTIEPVTSLHETEISHRWPDFLPGGKALLMTVQFLDHTRIEALTLSDGKRRPLVEEGHYARYVPSGHLIFIHNGTLFAAPFDDEKVVLLGDPVPVLEDILVQVTGGAEIAFSNSGDLIYIRRSSRPNALVWVDRRGQITLLDDSKTTRSNPRLSTDGRYLAFEIREGNQFDIRIQDLEGDADSRRFTFDESNDRFPVWTPNGTQIIFASDRTGVFNLYRKQADGAGDPARLSESPYEQYPSSISPDGRILAFMQYNPDSGYDIWTMALEEGAEPEPFIQTEYFDGRPTFSPDGDWLAYCSNGGVYVRSFPKGPGKWQISADQGTSPQWSRTADELFYVSPEEAEEGAMYVVSFAVQGDAFRPGTPKQLFPFQQFAAPIRPFQFDLAPDGKRFVMLTQVTGQVGDRLILVSNWFQELRSRTQSN